MVTKSALEEFYEKVKSENEKDKCCPSGKEHKYQLTYKGFNLNQKVIGKCENCDSCWTQHSTFPMLRLKTSKARYILEVLLND